MVNNERLRNGEKEKKRTGYVSLEVVVVMVMIGIETTALKAGGLAIVIFLPQLKPAMRTKRAHPLVHFTNGISC